MNENNILPERFYDNIKDDSELSGKPAKDEIDISVMPPGFYEDKNVSPKNEEV